MNRSATVASFLMAMTLLGPDTLAADPPYDGSTFRGGPGRTGDLGAIKLPETGAVAWRVDIPGGAGQAVVADGVVYLGGGSSLFAIKADGSAILWQEDRPRRRVGAAPLVVGDRLYVASSQGLSAHARADGKLIWDYPIEAGADISSPLLVVGRVVFAARDGFVHAVDPATGLSAWRHDIVKDAPPEPPGFAIPKGPGNDSNPAAPGTLASDGSTLYVPIFDQSRVVAIDAATGQRRWSFGAKGWIHAETTVVGDDLFVASQDKKLYCLDKATGKPRWDFPTGWRVESGVAVRGGSAYFGSCDGFFYRVDLKTGKKVWKFETPTDADRHYFPIYSSPLVDAETVCFGSFDGFLYVLKVETGEVKWKVRAIEGAEVVSSPCTDGRLVFLSVRYDQFKKKGADALVAIGAPPG